jgi:hypothetical protein
LVYALRTSKHHLQDNGNCIFDDTLSVLELTDVASDFDCNIDEVICESNYFVENVLIYISGFIVRMLIKKEKCAFCCTFLKDSKNRVSCALISKKQRGGLIHLIQDVVSVVNFTNRNVKLIL